MGEGTILAKIIYGLDQNILSQLLPRILAPFEYLIATKQCTGKSGMVQLGAAFVRVNEFQRAADL